MKHTREFTRHTCIVGARLVTYSDLEDVYVCRECGGSPVHKIRWNESFECSEDLAECAECGGKDFISRAFYERQAQDYERIARGLPKFLQELIGYDVKAEAGDADEAIADLYDS